jgi:hypothetical protein
MYSKAKGMFSSLEAFQIDKALAKLRNGGTRI